MRLSPADLLEHRDFVRALARRLIFDEDRAEDVVQETWLAALRSPPRDRSGLKGWFATVVRNFARRAARSDRRRGLRERRAARPDAVDSTEEAVERVQWHRRVVDEVLALEEPYRSTVILRFFDDLTPKAIAERDGVPASTVRVRLHRALETLRGRLDQEAGQSRRTWALALLPLALPKEALGGAAAAAAATTGGVVMKAKTNAVVALLVLGLIGTGLVVERAVRTSEHGERTAHSTGDEEYLAERPFADLAPEEPAAAPAQGPAPAKPDEAIRERAEEPVGSVAISGSVSRDGQPVPVQAVLLARADSPYRPVDLWQTGRLETVQVDRAGGFRFEKLAPGDYWIGVDLRDGQIHESMVTAAPDVEIGIRLGTARIEGYVYDSNGHPVTGALVHVNPVGPAKPAGVWVRTGPGGFYFVSDLEAGLHWIGATRKGDPWKDGNTETLQAETVSNSVTRVDFGTARELPEWRGTVRKRDGIRIGRQCIVQLNPIGSSRGYSKYPTDESGRFAIRTPAGRYDVFVQGADRVSRNYGNGHYLGVIEARDGVLERDLVIPDARIRGRVTLDGAPLATELRKHLMVQLRRREASQWVFRTAKTGRDGTFDIPDLAPGAYSVECKILKGVRGLEEHRREITIDAADREVRVDLALRSR